MADNATPANPPRPSLLVMAAFAMVAAASLFGRGSAETEGSNATLALKTGAVRPSARDRDAAQKAGLGGPAPQSGLQAAQRVDHPPGIVGIAKSVFARFGRDNVTLVAAGVAYYVFLSIFPALAALVSIYGLFSDPAEVGRQIAPLANLLPPEAMKLLNDGLQKFVEGIHPGRPAIANGR